MGRKNHEIRAVVLLKLQNGTEKNNGKGLPLRDFPKKERYYVKQLVKEGQAVVNKVGDKDTFLYDTIRGKRVYSISKYVDLLGIELQTQPKSLAIAMKVLKLSSSDIFKFLRQVNRNFGQNMVSYNVLVNTLYKEHGNLKRNYGTIVFRKHAHYYHAKDQGGDKK